MGLAIKDKGGKDFKKVPEGVHIAVCNMIVDCGVQSGGKFKPQQKVYIRWEIPTERVEYERDGKNFEGPMSIGKFYTASLSEKATLRKDLENWRGRSFTKDELAGFDLFNILGAACQIMVTHTTGADQKIYANVTGVMGLPKGTVKPKAENPLVKFSPEDPGQWDQLPEWLREKVQSGHNESPTSNQAAPADDDFDDEVPF